MNRNFIKYNFQEIEEEVSIVLKGIQGSMTHEDFYKSVQHIYHHLNIAFNARNTEDNVVYDLDDMHMDEWKEFPKNLKLY